LLTPLQINDAIDAAIKAAVIKTDLMLDPVRFMIDRGDLDHYNGIEEDAIDLAKDLGACEDRECETCGECESSFLGGLWTGWIVAGIVVVAATAFAAGALLSYELGKPRPVTAL
jgi:hypothetical protein